MTTLKSKTQMIMVDASKLSEGLKTTFSGVAMIFDSLGVDASLELPVQKTTKAKKSKVADSTDGASKEDEIAVSSDTGKEVVTEAVPKATVTEEKIQNAVVSDEHTEEIVGVKSEETVEKATSDTAGNAPANAPANATGNTAGEETVVDESDANTVGNTNESVKETKPEPTVPSKPESSVTIDDITKIIVQKIKKDRSNNEKIGQTLKTYGVVKISDLDPGKYEAFLTDIAAL